MPIHNQMGKGRLPHHIQIFKLRLYTFDQQAYTVGHFNRSEGWSGYLSYNPNISSEPYNRIPFLPVSLFAQIPSPQSL